MLLDTSPLVSDSTCLLVCLLVCAWPQVPRTLYYDALVKFGFVGGTSEANDLGFTDAPDTVFERLDSNQNGFLSVEELEAGLKGIFKDKARAPQPPATPPLNKVECSPPCHQPTLTSICPCAFDHSLTSCHVPLSPRPCATCLLRALRPPVTLSRSSFPWVTM